MIRAARPFFHLCAHCGQPLFSGICPKRQGDQRTQRLRQRESAPDAHDPQNGSQQKRRRDDQHKAAQQRDDMRLPQAGTEVKYIERMMLKPAKGTARKYSRIPAPAVCCSCGSCALLNTPTIPSVPSCVSAKTRAEKTKHADQRGTQDQPRLLVSARRAGAGEQRLDALRDAGADGDHHQRKIGDDAIRRRPYCRPDEASGS